MCSKRVALFFSILFMSVLVVPSIMTMADTDFDVAIFIDTNEEEEKKGNESLKDIEIKIIQSIEKLDLLTSDELNSLHDFYSNRYNSEFKELTSPPPEQYIL